MKSQRTFYLLMAVLVAILLLASFASLFGGRLDIGAGEVAQALLDGLSGDTSGDLAHAVVWKLRVPRLLLDMVVGLALSSAGCVFQGIFRNPLVSPDVLGVSSGAAFGAVLGILLAGTGVIPAALSLVFGLSSVVLAYSLSLLRGETTPLSLVLAGMIVSAVFSALISLIKYVADPYDTLPAITFWLMGSFSSASFASVISAGIPILLGTDVMLALRWRINLLSLGDEEAKSLGVRPERLRRVLIGLGTLVTAASVMVTGIVGWVGLVIPHLARMLVGVDHQRVLPMTCVMGALFMVVVDFIARTASAAELPIGILTALVGAPFFAVLFKRMGGGLR